MSPSHASPPAASPAARRRAGRAMRLLRYAGPYRAAWCMIAGLTVAATLLSLAQPWPLKLLVDHVLQPASRAGSVPGAVAWIALSGIAIFAANAAIEVALTRAWVRVGQRMVYELAADVFARLQRRSLQFHRGHDVGDLMARVTGDSWCVYKLVDTCLLTPAKAFLLIGLATAVMASMDGRLALAALAVAPLVAGVNVAIGRRTRAAARAAREIESRLQAHVHQTLTGIQVVQAFARETHEARRFRDFAGMAVRAQRRGVWLGSASDLVTGTAATLGTGVVLCVGAGRVVAGTLSVGGLLLFLGYLTSLYDQMKALIVAYQTVQGLGAQIDRVTEALEGDGEIADRPGLVSLARARGEIQLERVTFGYAPGRPALHEVSLHARPGEMVALVGPTGAGKSTLVSLIARFADPWSGNVTLDGHALRDLSLQSVRRNVAIVFQEPFLFPVSIARNIAFGRPGATEDQIEAAARAARAHEFITRLPEGYDTIVGERGCTLSGGERQRVNIARALLKDAPVLILDEPTSAIDAETESLLLEALRELMRGRTTFVIAHRLSTVRHADRILVVDAGRIVEVGTHEELAVAGGLYAQLWGLSGGGDGPRPKLTTIGAS